MRTFLSFADGRLEIRLRRAAHCSECGTEYHPRVQAYPGVVISLGLVATLLVVVVGVMWFTGRGERVWLLWAKVAAGLIVVVIGVMAARLQNRLLQPTLHSPVPSREPAYGEIVLECPRCGSTAVAKA